MVKWKFQTLPQCQDQSKAQAQGSKELWSAPPGLSPPGQQGQPQVKLIEQIAIVIEITKATRFAKVLAIELAHMLANEADVGEAGARGAPSPAPRDCDTRAGADTEQTRVALATCGGFTSQLTWCLPPHICANT